MAVAKETLAVLGSFDLLVDSLSSAFRPAADTLRIVRYMRLITGETTRIAENGVDLARKLRDLTAQAPEFEDNVSDRTRWLLLRHADLMADTIEELRGLPRPPLLIRVIAWHRVAAYESAIKRTSEFVAESEASIRKLANHAWAPTSEECDLSVATQQALERAAEDVRAGRVTRARESFAQYLDEP